MKPNSRVKAFLNKNFDSIIVDNDEIYRLRLRHVDYPKVDYIISYLSPWIIPKKILELATRETINFHPAPPKYPGSGGYNWAIYNKEWDYGCVAHRMHEKVDSGPIFKWKSFTLFGNETVKELKDRTHLWLEALFYDTMIDLRSLHEQHKWLNKPYTFKDLEELCNCNGIVDPEELALRIRATTYPGGKHFPFITINNKKYKLIEVKNNEHEHNVIIGRENESKCLRCT